MIVTVASPISGVDTLTASADIGSPSDSAEHSGSTTTSHRAPNQTADAAAFEVEEAQRAAEIRIGQAQTAQAAVERAVTTAAKEAAVEAQADAEEALVERSGVLTPDRRIAGGLPDRDR